MHTIKNNFFITHITLPTRLKSYPALVLMLRQSSVVNTAFVLAALVSRNPSSVSFDGYPIETDFAALVLNLLKDILERSLLSLYKNLIFLISIFCKCFHKIFCFLFEKIRCARRYPSTSSGRAPRYNKIVVLVLFIFFSLSSAKFDPKLIQFDAYDIDSNTKKIILTFIVPENDFIYKDFIHCSIQEPNVVLSDWKADKQSIDYYDSAFNTTKEVFNETFSLSMTASITKESPNPLHFYCSYYRKSEKKINHVLFDFSFSQPIPSMNSYEESSETGTKTSFLNRPVSVLDVYTNHLMIVLHNCINHAHNYAYVYFFAFLFLLCILIIISYCYKNQLQKYDSLHETLIFTQLLLAIIVSGFISTYLASLHFPQIGFTFCWLSSLYVGFLYIKKSSTIKIELLRVLSTFLGIFLIAGSFILLFKALQF